MTVSKKKGWYKGFHMWLNPDGIANLLSAGLLEAEGYKIEYKTGGDWIVTTPTGEKIVFQRESEGVLQGHLSYRQQSVRPTKDSPRVR